MISETLNKPNKTSVTLQLLKSAGEDFEWYPTTSEIIATVCRDMMGIARGSYSRSSNKLSFLDVGAGDGRVLTRVKANLERVESSQTVEMYAIEIANVHLNNMPKEVTVIGTDFMEQSMIDKTLDVAFSNPPYSEFDSWSVKLIRESAVKFLYLVIPDRWEKSIDIQAAIKMRSAKVEILGKFDFENAERQARARVHVLKIKLRGTHDGEDSQNSAFDNAIESMLPELAGFDRLDGEPDIPTDNASEVIDSSENVVEALVMAYDAEVASMISTYRDAVKINPRLLAELGVSKESILKGIRFKIKGLKEKYWATLFAKFKPITTRLATKQRKEFLESLTGKATIDFTEGNILSMLIWITKWSNDHFDTQLIELFQSLSEFCNVVNYKSNERVWTKGDWRYKNHHRHDEEELGTCYKLEYRIVLEHAGGISTSSYHHDQENGLQRRAFDYLLDVITVANNLGFQCEDSPGNYQWESNKQHVFKLADGKPLVAVRAFKNGNMHLHFNPKVMLSINVEAGRLLGWLRTPEQAAREMNATKAEQEIIEQVFWASMRIGANSILKLGNVSLQNRT